MTAQTSVSKQHILVSCENSFRHWHHLEKKKIKSLGGASSMNLDCLISAKAAFWASTTLWDLQAAPFFCGYLVMNWSTWCTRTSVSSLRLSPWKACAYVWERVCVRPYTNEGKKKHDGGCLWDIECNGRWCRNAYWRRTLISGLLHNSTVFRCRSWTERPAHHTPAELPREISPILKTNHAAERGQYKSCASLKILRQRVTAALDLSRQLNPQPHATATEETHTTPATSADLGTAYLSQS